MTFKEIVDKLMKENDGLMKALADDTSAMKSIQARDGCAYCGSKKYPCDCQSKDRNF